ncbi:cellulose biosynthesis protein BcsP [Paraburkholderia fungorum]|uniref:cellulose biosynthesis protein BcsP n=1 Tax=Paraburkholderia fungorum TaxID=134537 RepID=UPI0038BC307A
MSSSSDIEKLFDHFGGDANAYQEIGRENEARSARTRWPLLVTLDLTQPKIPAIGQRREPPREPLASTAQAAAIDRQDTTPKDAVSVTRAKAPLFTRSHRRDIPPVATAAAQPAAPSGASRFGALEANADADAQAAPSTQAASAPARLDAAAPAATRAAPAVALPQMSPTAAQVAPAPVPPIMSRASIPPVAQSRAPAMPVAQPVTGMSPSAPTPARAGIPAVTPRAAAPTWTQAPSVHAQAHTHTPTYTTAPAAPKPPASILGKLFASEPELASAPQPAAPVGESVPLQSVFDRLRGTPAQTAAAPAAAPATTAGVATAAVSNSWLVNGPRRS